MNFGFLYFLGGLLLFILFGLAGYFIYLIFKEKKDPEDQSILINFMPQYTGEFALGTIDSIEKSKDLSKIVFFPRDLDYVKLTKKQKDILIKPQVLIALNKNIIYLPKGSLSGHRNFVIVLPPKPEEIPEKLKETKFGEVIMEFLSKKEVELEEERHLRKVIKGISKLNEMQLPEEVVKNFIEKQKELGNSVPNNISIERKEE